MDSAQSAPIASSTRPLDDSAAGQAAAASFSLCKGGPVYAAGRWLGISNRSTGLWQLGIVIALLTWLPLLALNAFEVGLRQRQEIPLLHSIGTHVRLLLCIPMFFVAEALFDTRAPDALRRILEIRLVLPGQIPRLTQALQRAVRRRDWWLMEAALVALTIALIWFGLRTDTSVTASTWRTNSDGGLSAAGWWYTLVSIPTFQFLVWRWTWRLLIWGALLWELSRLDLQLIPTHPDGAGGLGVLGVTHVDLAPLAFAGCAVLSANYAEQILYGNVPVSAFAVSLTAAVIGTTLALILPLLFFSPRLIDVKQRALLEYGTLAAHYTRSFAAKWLKTDPPPDEPILGTPDIQSLADLATSFGLIQGMSTVPISRTQILFILANAALPFVPLGLLAFPLDELIINSLKSVLNV
jgi:hypothetical protein